MELDRFCVFLSALCVVFAAETTLDTAPTTSATSLPEGTEVTEQLPMTTLRSEKKTPPTADTRLDNEIEIEERATSAATRSTEEAPTVKELPTTKLEATTVEEKDILVDNDLTTTTASPPPVHVTERSSVTKEAAEPTSQRTTTAAPSRGTVVATTPSAVSQRPTKLKQTKNKTRPRPTTTTAIPPKRQEIKKEQIPQQSPAASSILKVTARPHRKPTVEVKKGTINSGGLQQYKKRKPSKKDNGMSSLMYIPLMIQAQMIPMMIMQLKFFALKALAIGKLALLILGLNLLRNAFIGYHNDEQQYEQESLASAHYGYNGGPEYGSWINRRMFRVDPAFTNHKPIPDAELSKNNGNIFANGEYELIRPQRRLSNNPYRGYETYMLKKIT